MKKATTYFCISDAIRKERKGYNERVFNIRKPAKDIKIPTLVLYCCRSFAISSNFSLGKIPIFSTAAEDKNLESNRNIPFVVSGPTSNMNIRSPLALLYSAEKNGGKNVQCL